MARGEGGQTDRKIDRQKPKHRCLIKILRDTRDLFLTKVTSGLLICYPSGKKATTPGIMLLSPNPKLFWTILDAASKVFP